MAMMKCLAHMKNRFLGMGWNSWRAHYMECMRQADAMLKCLRHMENRVLGMGWNTWRQWYKDVIHQQDAMAKTMGHWQHGPLSKGWNTWRQYYLHVLHQQTVLTKALQHMLHMALGKAWNTWRQWYVDILHQQMAMMKCLRHMENRVLGMGWNTWCQWYSDCMRHKHAMLRSLKHMMNRKLTAAWNSWRKFYLDILHQQRAMLKCLQHMLHKKLAMGWNTWRAWAASMRRQNGLLQRSLMRWSKRTLFSAFNTWRAEAKNFLRALKHWVNMTLARAWNKWQAVHAARLRELIAMNKSFRRWENLTLCKAWNQWSDYVKQSKAEKRMLLRALGHARNLMLGKAWNKWVSLNLREVAAVNWIQMWLKKGWRKWIEFYHLTKRIKRIAARALKVWSHRQLSRAFRKWHVVMLGTRNALANQSWIDMRDAALRVQKEAAAKLMRAFLSALQRMITARAVIQWRGNRISDVGAQMMEYMNLLIADRDAAREAEAAIGGANHVLLSEREALEIKLKMLEEDFRCIQGGVLGAQRVHMQVEDLTILVRAMEDKLRVVEAQRLRLHQEVMAGREAGETMELAVVELNRMKDGMFETIHRGHDDLCHARDMQEGRIIDLDHGLQEAQNAFAEERRSRIAAEEEIRRIQIDIEQGGANTAGVERERMAEAKGLLADNMALKDMNSALQRELQASEHGRRQAETVASTPPPFKALTAPMQAPTHSPPPLVMVGRLEAAAKEAGSRSSEIEALKQELGAVTNTLQLVAEERDQLQGVVRAQSGLVGSPHHAARSQLTSGPRPSQVPGPPTVQEAENFFARGSPAGRRR